MPIPAIVPTFILMLAVLNGITAVHGRSPWIVKALALPMSAVCFWLFIELMRGPQ